ncbi:MAG: hypothetical protein AAF739_05205 [Pseudomonadota bacterium]
MIHQKVSALISLLNTRSVLPAVATVVAGLVLVQPASAQQVGVSAAVRGSVSINASSASSGQSMFLGDRVLTQTLSGMQVLLLDESVFTIGENNDLTITRFIYDPDRSVGQIAASATRGAFRFVSGSVGAVAPDSIEMTTPSATIGIRGTSVDIVVGQEAVDLAVRLGVAVGLAGIDPATAVFVILGGPSVSYQGLTQRGRVIVQTAAGRVAIRREGFGVFVPGRGAAPTSSFAVPDDIAADVIAKIEIPTVGVTSTLPSVNVTTLPNVEPLPGVVPDLSGAPVDEIDTFELEVRVDELIEELLGKGEGEEFGFNRDPEPADPDLNNFSDLIDSDLSDLLISDPDNLGSSLD